MLLKKKPLKWFEDDFGIVSTCGRYEIYIHSYPPYQINYCGPGDELISFDAQESESKAKAVAAKHWDKLVEPGYEEVRGEDGSKKEG